MPSERELDRRIASARGWRVVLDDGQWSLYGPDETSAMYGSPTEDAAWEHLQSRWSNWTAAGELWAELVEAELRPDISTDVATTRVIVASMWLPTNAYIIVRDGDWQAAAANAIAQAWLAAYDAGLLGQGEANDGK